MPVDKRKLLNNSNYQTWLLPVYFSTQTFYVLLILISFSWNAYNTHQYRLLAERQMKLENILAELLPSSSSIVQIQHEQTRIEQWFNQIYDFIEQIFSKNTKSIKVTTTTTPIPVDCLRKSFFYSYSYIPDY